MTGAVQLDPARARFVVPPGRMATEPPEARGLERDQVRMLFATPGRLRHHTVRDLPGLLHPGDLVVVNTSATVPAAVDARWRGHRSVVHVSTQLDDGGWVVEVRRPDNRGPARPESNEILHLPHGQLLRLVAPYPRQDQRRLWRATPLPAARALDYLAEHGRPIEYDYLTGSWPLADRQTVFASVPGSAEMPSAGRPLTAAALVRLVARGIPVAPVLLHAGVSSQEAGEPPQPEQYTVPDVTARLVNSTRYAGRRVVAVGTTVVRAVESATAPDGRVHAATGWTDLVLGRQRPARAVSGLLSGLHPADASHLDLLDAVAGPALVDAAYAAATQPGGPPYLWHEFGDTMILLAPPSTSRAAAANVDGR